MELEKAILERRSIRKFKGAPVPENIVMEIIKLACSAPSPGNRQMWHFTVITNNNLKDNLAGAINETFEEMLKDSGKEASFLSGAAHGATFFRKAPVVIAVSTLRYSSRFDEAMLITGRDQAYIDNLRCRPDLQSVGAAIQTMLLVAYERGLGTCYMTGPMAARHRLEEILEIKQPRSLAAFVAMGYPEVEPHRKALKDFSEMCTVIR